MQKNKNPIRTTLKVANQTRFHFVVKTLEHSSSRRKHRELQVQRLTATKSHNARTVSSLHKLQPKTKKKEREIYAFPCRENQNQKESGKKQRVSLFEIEESTNHRFIEFEIGVDGVVVALAAVLFLVLTTNVENNPRPLQQQEEENENKVRIRRRLQVLSTVPAALILFLFGLLLCFRLGGRSGALLVFLGIAKLVLSLVFGNSLRRILGEFSIWILGMFLLFAGTELAMASRDMNTKQESFVMLVCVVVSLTGPSAAFGFFVGIVLYLVLKLRELECAGFLFGFCLSKTTKSSLQEEHASLIA
ncbi:Molybdate transporter 2 Sulfate transporter like protein [Vigna angularis]|uniref:Molybdate transporter 2 Sulfate transporter like protein n=1 Tax=Phaseolus angularis TaxID=3914 RepID=A0A8T0L5K6_PHAAN|nr:Molybdate transporter 2 Sulfate transporter like protein [Vigna angularis]